MSSFAILRTNKINSKYKLIKASRHNAMSQYRQGFTTGTGGVEILHGSKNALNEFNEHIKSKGIKKVRKDAVLAIEFLATFSPEMKDKVDVEAWAKDTLEYFKNKYGEDRLLQVVLHTDETTPHIHVMMCPTSTKKHKKGVKTTLAARDFINGPEVLSGLQDEYHKAVEHHGLDRGVKGSKRKHQSLSQINAEMLRLQQEAEQIKAQELDPQKYPKPPEKRGLFAGSGIDYQAAYAGIKKSYSKLKQRYNDSVKQLRKLTKLNKALERGLQRSEARNNDLERILSNQGINEIQEENEHLKSENKHMRQALQRDQGTIEAQREALESWKMGGRGLPLSPAQKAFLSAQRERERQRELDATDSDLSMS